MATSSAAVCIEEFVHRTTLYSGQHSQVVSAQDTFDGSTVVIKSYKKAQMHAGHIRNVQREIDVMVVLGDSDCRGVVRMLYAFEDEESYHLVYEPCMRGDLYQMKTKQGTLDENYVALSVVAPLLSTLSVLHSLNIVHRDIKAENIFVSATGELKLGDFGLAAHTIHDPLIDRVGTLDYMAPEVLSLPIPSHQVKPSTSDHATASAVIVTAFKGRTSCEGNDKREKIRKQLSKNSENVMLSELSRSSNSGRASPDLSQLRSASDNPALHSPRSPSQEDRHSGFSDRLSPSSPPSRPPPPPPPPSLPSYNEKVDVWAVGVLVFELLLGKTPFEVDNPKETTDLILKASITDRFPSSSDMVQIRGEKGPLSSECRAFISAALEKSPEKRPTAAQLMSHEWLTMQTRKARPNSTSPRLQNMDVAVVGKAMNDAWGSSMKHQREDATRSMSFTLQRASPGGGRSPGNGIDLNRTYPSGAKGSDQSPGEKLQPSSLPLTASNLFVADALTSPPSEAAKEGDKPADGSDSDQSLGSVESGGSHAWQAPPVASKSASQLRKSRFAS